jgi:hypothetical protein
MDPHRIVMQGRVTPDGGLELQEKLTLPPGPVEVTVQVSPSEAAREDTWAVLERIWAERVRRGIEGRSKQQIDAEINALRDQSEDRMREIERTYEEARRHRGQPPC